MRFVQAAVLALFVLLLDGMRAQATPDGRVLVVSTTGPFTTIQSALAAAQDGDVVQVQSGTYAGPVVVNKSVTLEGLGRPIVDNRGKGTVVMISAPGVVLRGFELRGSGSEPDQDHSGVILTAPHVTVENNRLTDVLFGIFVSKAPDAVVRENEISSKLEYDLARRGDAIRLWYSPRTLVESNHVRGARDLVVWYSTDVKITGNTVEQGRYGIHLMYCDGAQINDNRILDDSVGIYTMYSNNITLRGNWIRRQRGPSGYALGFKDTDNVEVGQNVLVDNRAGIYMDGMPFSPQGYGRVHDNILAFNDVGVIALPAVRGNDFSNNTFWENLEQVAVQGGGDLSANHWLGNYWSDYAGYDANGDGRGDVPYRAERSFEGLTDREPLLRALIYGPAQQAIEFAGSAFPVIRPRQKFSDPAPNMAPNAIPPFASQHAANWGGIASAALLLLALSGVIGWIAWRKGNPMLQASRQVATGTERSTSPVVTANPHGPGICINGLTKRYHRVLALDHISLEARAGEAIALWGPNGAGKTTLLKAILGLIDFEGEIEIEGKNVRCDSKGARRSIGYVPQQADFYDMTVQATMRFYARLKTIDPAGGTGLLKMVGLAEHVHKPVSALSGGLQQRLALAIALLGDAPILLLDEPTANLDSQARREYMDLLATLHHQGKTILFASHRVEEVMLLADRVLVLQNGTLERAISPEALASMVAPEVRLTLWISEGDRARAVARLRREGLAAHINGRGTVIVPCKAQDKMHPLNVLRDEGISVSNLEVEGAVSWN